MIGKDGSNEGFCARLTRRDIQGTRLKKTGMEPWRAVERMSILAAKYAWEAI